MVDSGEEVETVVGGFLVARSVPVVGIDVVQAGIASPVLPRGIGGDHLRDAADPAVARW